MHRLSIVLLLALFSTVALAKEPDLNQLKTELARYFPGTSLDNLKVRASPMAGLYEAELDGQVFYVNADGRYLFMGDLYDLKSRTNLSETAREKLVVKLLDDLGEQNMIVIGPASAKRTITVFTDVDCPYCVRLHQDVPELNKEGVKVRYLLFPRAGKGSETYQRSVAVWCADDRVKAVGVAKAGGKLDIKTCANPVDRHYALGEKVGISGTPTIFLDNGRRLSGYVPAPRLLAILGLKGAPQAAAH